MTVEEQKEFRISVRELVEFIFRSGDLDNRQGRGLNMEAMQQGGRLHRKLQKSMGSGYRAEVGLAVAREYSEYSIRVEGRADGILTEEDGKVTIDEIKGVYRDVTRITEPVYVHLAQAMCYGYIYGTQQRLKAVCLQITYINLDTEQVRRIVNEYTVRELAKWFDRLIEEYRRWVDFSWQWRKKRNGSMGGLEFPFPYRRGQRDIVASVYRTILREKQIFIQAPTGVGKTMSVLFPAIRACGEDKAEKVFYLTARTITRTVAEEAVEILRGKGLCWKSVTLTAKNKLCLLDEPDCNPVACPRAKGHFDRVNEAVFALLSGEDMLTRELILRHAEQWEVCPFEMMLDLSEWVDGVICDYNYVFDPQARLKRYFAGEGRRPYLFLIDEAHNLVDRGREMYSAALYKEDFLEMKNLLKHHSPRLARRLGKCNRLLLEYKRTCDDYEVLANLGDFPVSLLNLSGELDRFLEESEDLLLRKRVLEFYFAVQSFLSIYEYLDENYVIYSRHDREGRFRVKLFCVNPAANLQACLDRGKCSVFFSATLLPVKYYRKMFSTRSDDYAIYAETSFSAGQRALLVASDVSSRYTRRGFREYLKIAEYIHQVTAGKTGNYMVFFPSYRMLADVYDVYEEAFGRTEGRRALLQASSMDEMEREAFIREFERAGEETLVGFCVMGGIFSEGIDLTGEKLIGAVIVGTGLPQLSDERKILMQYFEKKGENGFDYAYRFPGMNKVLQSAGRVIRTVTDRGIIALLDERFLEPDTLGLFPREWYPYQVVRRDTVEEAVNAFWRAGPGVRQG